MGENVSTRRLIVGTDGMRLVGRNPKREHIYLYNNGSATIYILDSKAQKKENGYPVPAGGAWDDPDCTGALFIVADSADQDIRVMTIGS